jgi:hypothetical protein
VLPKKVAQKMKSAPLHLRWFLAGMGQVLGISHSLPPVHTSVSEIEAIGGDFRAVGNDLRAIMERFPAQPETARALGQPMRQLELAGMS